MMSKKPMIEQDKSSWMAGVRAGYNDKASNTGSVADKLAYASGIVEGKAAKESGEALNDFWQRNRLSTLEAK